MKYTVELKLQPLSGIRKHYSHNGYVTLTQGIKYGSEYRESLH